MGYSDNDGKFCDNLGDDINQGIDPLETIRNNIQAIFK